MDFKGWLKKQKITITGDLASGKTTLADYLSKKYGLKRVYIGDLLRKIARERKIDFIELQHIAEKDLSIDRYLDEHQIKLAKKKGFILDAHLGWYFIPDSIKIYLRCGIDIAAKRVYDDIIHGKRKEEKDGIKTIEDVRRDIIERKRSELKRYKDYYNIDFKEITKNLEKQFDLIIDTSNYDKEHIKQNIIDIGKKVESYLRIRYITEKIIKKIKPKDDFLIKVGKKFVDILNETAAKHGIKAKAVLGGSVAKNTHLSGESDIDIFFAFDYKLYSKKDIVKGKKNYLSCLLEKIIKDIKPTYQRLWGSRDYFRLSLEKKNIEIVPILNIDEKNKHLAHNITDVSPLHVKWLNKITKKYPKLCDEIRLLKQFLKSIKSYGAESYVSGLSGHVVDILISYYGSFYNLLLSAINWKEGEVIDIVQYYKSKKEVMEKINKSKLGPLIVIDPIDKQRNAAAALNREQFMNIKQKVKEFLLRPSKRYFVIPKVSSKEIRSLIRKRYIVIKIKNNLGKEDVIGAKLLKIFKRIKNALVRFDFDVVDSGWYWDKDKISYMWFKPKNYRLSKQKIKLGPPLNMEKAIENFKLKNKSAKFYKRNKRIIAKVDRDYTNVNHLVGDVISRIRKNIKIEKIIDKIIII